MISHHFPFNLTVHHLAFHHFTSHQTTSINHAFHNSIQLSNTMFQSIPLHSIAWHSIDYPILPILSYSRTSRIGLTGWDKNKMMPAKTDPRPPPEAHSIKKTVKKQRGVEISGVPAREHHGMRPKRRCQGRAKDEAEVETSPLHPFPLPSLSSSSLYAHPYPTAAHRTVRLWFGRNFESSPRYPASCRLQVQSQSQPSSMRLVNPILCRTAYTLQPSPKP